VLLVTGNHLGFVRRHLDQVHLSAAPRTPHVRHPCTRVPLGKTDKSPNLAGKYVKENWKRQRKVNLKAIVRAIELTCGSIVDLTGREAPFFVATHITDPVQELL
jgi:hypothetical protein